MSVADFMIAAVLLPLVGALFIATSGARPNLREGYTILFSSVLMIVVFSMTPDILAGGRPSSSPIEIMPGVSIAFKAEPLGMLFAMIASGLWIINSMYSIGYMRGNNEPRQTQFYVAFAFAISATMGVAFAANLFTLFLFYEILTLSTYPLVTHKGNDAARAGGRTYLSILLFTSVFFLLPAIVSVYFLAGTLDFIPGGVFDPLISDGLIGFMALLFIYGIGKAAVMPVHGWLPAAMVAPTPVSALLHAVAVVKAGVFTVLKVIVYTFGTDIFATSGSTGWVVYVAGFTIIVASIIALGHDNLKKRLAYSTVSQLSYVVMAAAMATPLAIMGAAMHIAAHALGKITLFFAAGSIYTAAHKTEVSQLDGIGRRMPITMTAFAIGAVSMIGLPPTAGFLGKWYILSAAMESTDIFVLLVVFASTLLNAGYFIPIVYAAFLKPPKDPGEPSHGEAPWPAVLALSLTAAATLALFFYPDVVQSLARQLAGG